MNKKIEKQSKVKTFIDREPVASIVGAVLILAEAILFALPLFGADLTMDQLIAIQGILIAIAGIVSIALTRAKVTPMADPRDKDGDPAFLAKLADHTDEGISVP